MKSIATVVIFTLSALALAAQAPAPATPTNTQMMQIREMRAAFPGLIDQANAVVAKVPGLVKSLIGNGAIFPAIRPVPKG